MQKMISFYHNKKVNMLKFRCTLPNLAKIYLHKSSDVKFYPSTEGDTDLLQKIREDMVGGPTIVFTHKAVVDKPFIRKWTNLCKSVVGIDASQLYLYSICQTMPTGLYTRWDLDTETGRIIPRQNDTRSFENIVMSCFQRTRRRCKIESFYTTCRQKKTDCFSVDGFCSHCNTVFETMGCFHHFCPCRALFNLVIKTKRELDGLRRNYLEQKSFIVSEMWKCQWWRPFKTGTGVKEHKRELFPYRRSLAEYQILEETKSGKLFGYVQCSKEVPNKLKPHFANFSLLFKTL